MVNSFFSSSYCSDLFCRFSCVYMLQAGQIDATTRSSGGENLVGSVNGTADEIKKSIKSPKTLMWVSLVVSFCIIDASNVVQKSGCGGHQRGGKAREEEEGEETRVPFEGVLMGSLDAVES